MTLPVKNEDGLIVAVGNLQAVGDDATLDAVARGELGRPLYAEEDQRESLSGPRLRPVLLLRAAEEVAAVADILGCPLHVERAAGVVPEADDVALAPVALVPVRLAGIILVDLDGVPLEAGGQLGGRPVLQHLPQLWAHPGVPAQVGTVGPPTDETEGLGLALPDDRSVKVGRQRLPMELGQQRREGFRGMLTDELGRHI